MDPRGAAAGALSDPRGALAALAEATGRDFPHTRAARAETAARSAEAARALAAARLDPSASVVVFGSWAREELTAGSDDDWAVLCDDPAAGAAARAVEAAAAVLGGGGRAPGAQAVFGMAFSVEEVVERIGLEEDGNRNLTRRMLLLLESRELAGAVHERAWARVIDRYLEHARDYRPPRFLLNDLVRYWRTIAVDFEGKRRDTGDADPKWAARNAKLRTSRKVLFAGGLLPLLLCQTKRRADMPAFLTTWLQAPPTDRLAAAFLSAGAVAEGARALGAYDRWLGLQRDPDARRGLEALTAESRDRSPLFKQVRTIGAELQRGLLALLFDTPLSPLARQYAVF